MHDENNPIVTLETSMGPIRLELWPGQAPKTVENFLQYVDSGFYDGTIFHRVISNFMIQGGGMTADMESKSTADPIPNEASEDLSNQRGTIAMARTQEIHSATSQFFINVADNTFLDHRDSSQEGFGYAVFGRVVEGMPVVDAIKEVSTGQSGMHSDVPAKPVVIERAVRDQG